MTAPLILAFCAPGDRERVVGVRDAASPFGPGTRPVIAWEGSAIADSRPRILLGIGPAGCASLAAHVAERGLDGVAAVVLVEPAAPLLNGRVSPQGWPLYQPPLQDLEPLRAVAERARDAERVEFCKCGHSVRAHKSTPKGHRGRCRGLGGCDCIRYVAGESAIPPLRLVLAVSPEAPPCETCKGSGKHDPEWKPFTRYMRNCDVCSDAGLLSSAEVARELTGWSLQWDGDDATWLDQATNTEPAPSRIEGGLEYAHPEALVALRYHTRDALLAHGLDAALCVALEGLT